MTIFEYAAISEKNFEEQLKEVGKQRKTTFWSDMIIATRFGEQAIKDTYNRVVKEWIDNVEYYSEFVLVLNWMSWFWDSQNDSRLTNLFVTLFEEARDNGYKQYKDDKEKSYAFWEYLD